MKLKIGRYAITDSWTGEMLPYKPKGKHKNKTFYTIYFPGSENVTDYFLKFMSSTNIIQINDPAFVYNSLNISKATYHREINKMIRNNICIRISNTSYFINPERHIKGSRQSIPKLSQFYNALKNSKKQTIVKTEIETKVFKQQNEKIKEYEND